MKSLRQRIDAVNGHRRFSVRTGVVLGARLPSRTPAYDGVSWDFVRLSWSTSPGAQFSGRRRDWAPGARAPVHRPNPIGTWRDARPRVADRL